MKMELKEKWSWVDIMLPYLMGKNRVSERWGAKRWTERKEDFGVMVKGRQQFIFGASYILKAS